MGNTHSTTTHDGESIPSGPPPAYSPPETAYVAGYQAQAAAAMAAAQRGLTVNVSSIDQRITDTSAAFQERSRKPSKFSQFFTGCCLCGSPRDTDEQRARLTPR